MKPSRSRIAILALLCGTSLLQADILILKNGVKHEGTIVSESPAAVRMKYRITPKIWDEKDFPREEIQEVIKQTPQEVELIELRKLLPTQDLLPADKYEQLIQDRLRPFINQYPGTPEATEAEGIVNTLQEEKKRVSNGEAKLAGKWLSPSETKGETYNIEAYKILAEMRAAMTKNEWIAAMRLHDKFYKARPPLTASTYYPEALQEFITCLNKQDAVLSKMAQEQPALQKKRDEDLKKLPDDERARTKAAIDDEKNKARAQADAERRAGVRWSEPYKYDANSIATLQKTIVSERIKLELINPEDLKARNEALMAVYRKIGEGDYTGGAAAYSRIEAYGQSPEYRDIVADQKNKLLALYGELVRKSQAGQTAVSGSSAMGGTGAASEDDRVARILAGNSAAAAPAAGTAAPATGAPAATAPAGQAPAVAGAPVAGAPVAPAQAPVAGQPGAVAPVRAPVAAPAPIQQAPTYIPPVVEESNTQTYIMIGMGAIILLLGAFVFMKKK